MDNIVRKTYAIQLEGEELKYIEEISLRELRSGTQQIMKIIKDTIKNKPIKVSTTTKK